MKKKPEIIVKQNKKAKPTLPKCYNTLIVFGADEDCDALDEKAKGYSPWDSARKREKEPNALNFHSLVPIPAKVLAAGYEQAGLDWEKKHWGCTGGAFDAGIVSELPTKYHFDTLCSPPIAFCAAVARKWPELILLLKYVQPHLRLEGLARFEGKTKEHHRIKM